METRFEYWQRQTLREKPAQILADWSEERKELIGALKNTRAFLSRNDKSDQYDACVIIDKALEKIKGKNDE